jgi:hypothetical protein
MGGEKEKKLKLENNIKAIKTIGLNFIFLKVSITFLELKIE